MTNSQEKRLNTLNNFRGYLKDFYKKVLIKNGTSAEQAEELAEQNIDRLILKSAQD